MVAATADTARARLVAAHEAAHAAAAVGGGRRIRHVRADQVAGHCLVEWCQDKDAPLEEIITDLAALLVAEECDRLSLPPARGHGCVDAEIAREIAAGHHWTRNGYEAEQLIELARARAVTLAQDPGFRRLVEVLTGPLLEAGEMTGEEIIAILDEGSTDGPTT
jgi:hypothetical protein